MRYLMEFESFDLGNISFDDVNILAIISSSIPFGTQIEIDISAFLERYGYESGDCVALGTTEIKSRNNFIKKVLNSIKTNPNMEKEFISLMSRCHDTYLKYYPDLIELESLSEELLEPDNQESCFMFVFSDNMMSIEFDSVDSELVEKLSNRIQNIYGNKCVYMYNSTHKFNYGNIIKIYKS